MMVSLKGLPDALRGIAWPSSARAARAFTKVFFKKGSGKGVLLTGRGAV